MSKINEKIMKRSKSISSIQRSHNIVKIISNSSIIELNNSIESKIRHNKYERNASMNAADNCIVK